jgi:hypothetical protein
MKILIEDAQTLKFLAVDGSWTAKSADAAGYRSSTVAKEAGARVQVGRFNVVGIFKNSPQITNLDEGCGLRGERAAHA